MNAKDLLAQIDAHAASYDFPVLDNAYWRLIAGRLRGFRREAESALVFEILVFHTQAQAFLTNVYAYGTLFGPRQADVGAFSPIDEIAEQPLWDDHGEWIYNDRERVVSISGALVTVVDDAQLSKDPVASSEKIILSHGDGVDEAAFARALLRELGIHRLMPDHALLNILPMLADANEVARLSNWDHPDVIGGERPSDSVAITQVAMVVAGESDQVRYDHAADNVDWRSWG